jgi:diacylglycerol kinase (ATP)
VTHSVALLVNPTSGGGRGAREGRAAADRLRSLGLGVRLLEGKDSADAARVARDAVQSGVDALVVAGGDGMVHLGVQCVAGTDVPLGIVPTGTGNDFATGLGLPAHDATGAAGVIAAWQVRTVDAVLTRSGAGQRWFAGVLSSGFDSAVNERGNRMRWPKGRSRYNLAILAELGVFKAVPFRLTIDGRVIEAEAMLAAVGNNTSYGGGMKVAPGAVLDDGQLHVTVLRKVGTVEFLRVFPRVYKGTHVSHRAVDVYVGREVTLEAPGAIAYADGERIGPLPITATCVPKALRVLVPPEA